MAGRFQFSLKWLFVLIAICAVLVLWLKNTTRKATPTQFQITIRSHGASAESFDRAVHETLVEIAKRHPSVESVVTRSSRRSCLAIVTTDAFDGKAFQRINDFFNELNNVSTYRNLDIENSEMRMVGRNDNCWIDWSSKGKWSHQTGYSLIFELQPTQKWPDSWVRNTAFPEIWQKVNSIGPLITEEEAIQARDRLNQETVGGLDVTVNRLGSLHIEPIEIVSEWRR